MKIGSDLLQNKDNKLAHIRQVYSAGIILYK